MPEPAYDPHERLLDQILGHRAIAGQEEGEPARGRNVPLVEFGEHSAGGCVSLLRVLGHDGVHTREDAGGVQEVSGRRAEGRRDPQPFGRVERV
jgi:hypothetical protein